MLPIGAWRKVSRTKAAASRALGRDPALAQLRCEAGESPRLRIPLRVISRGDFPSLSPARASPPPRCNAPPSPNVLTTVRGTPTTSRPSRLTGAPQTTHFSKPGCSLCPPQLSAHSPRATHHLAALRVTPQVHEGREPRLPPVTDGKTHSRTGSTHPPAGKRGAEGTTACINHVINHVIAGSFPPIGGTSNFWMGCNMVLVVPFHKAPSPAATHGRMDGPSVAIAAPNPSFCLRQGEVQSPTSLSFFPPHAYFKEYFLQERVFQGTEVWMQTDEKILLKMEAQPEPQWKGTSNGTVSKSQSFL